jgi:hypothetical protein
MSKKQIRLQSLIEQIKLDFNESEPSQNYLDCEQKYGGINGNDPIWRLVEEAITYAVQETIDYLDGYEVEH